MLLTMLGLTVILAGCGSGGASSSKLTSDDVVEAFEDAGLVVEDKRAMTKDDYGVGPMKSTSGTIFTVPFVCSDCSVRVTAYDNDADLEQSKAYYDDLGAESAMLFSWTIAHSNILVQLNGDMEEADYEKYKAALEDL